MAKMEVDLLLRGDGQDGARFTTQLIKVGAHFHADSAHGE